MTTTVEQREATVEERAARRQRSIRPTRWMICIGVSILVLIPCFWQTRIQAGDLSSHLYNAWLVQLIERGQAPGLTLARQTNNVLFDLMLSGLLPVFGAVNTERIAVSAAVLVFFWGAFSFVWSFSRRSGQVPWHLALCVAMLAYGWVYHMGLFNFYMSLGLCLGGLALATRRKLLCVAGALPLFGMAYLAHALPVAWAGGALVYYWAARALRPRYRVMLCGACLASLGVLATILCTRFGGRWSEGQAVAMTGAEQLWVFGLHYVPLIVALLAIWVLWFQRLLDTLGTERLILDIRFQICLLCAAGAIIIPGAVMLPGMRHTLGLIGERMSLATAVVFCSLAASIRPSRGEIAALSVIAMLFFAAVFADEHALNRIETRMSSVVAQIPAGQRVVSALADPNSRVNSMAHVIDRVCMERCFSYANYEPSTAQFRVRANAPNPIVAWQYSQSYGMQVSGYVVEKSDLPLYRIDLCNLSGDELCIAPLEAGVKLKPRWLPVSPMLGKWDHRRAPE